MAGTPELRAKISPALIAAAAAAYGKPDVGPAELVRAALARLAGVNPEDYRRPVGRPPKETAA